MRRIDRGGERGAVAVLVAVLMVALVGFAALGIDVAQMASHKQQLQNGADAGALAVAQSCANGDCGSYNATAASMAQSNRNDGQASGVVLTPGLTPATRKVTVEASGVSDHWLAPVLGFDETLIGAEATAVWGGYGGGEAYLPIVVSVCEIQQLLGTAFTENPADSGNYEMVSDSPVRVLDLPHPSDPVPGCTVNGSPYIPGGFSFIYNTDKNSCSVFTKRGIPVPSNTGNDTPNDCTYAYLLDLVTKGTVIPIPLFDDTQGDVGPGSGGTGTYTIRGYVGFVMTGFGLSTDARYFDHTPRPCNGIGHDKCLEGVFTTYVELDGELDPDAPNLGVTTVKLTK